MKTSVYKSTIMKMTNKRSNKKTIIITILLIVLIAIAGYAAYAVNHSMWPFYDPPAGNTIDYNPPTEAQKETGNAISDEAKQDEAAAEEQSDNTVSMEISSTSQENNQLRIRTLIHTVEPGTCTLNMTKSGQDPVTRTVDTQSLSSTSTCKGFDIPTSELARGEWNLEIRYKGNSGITSNVQQNITVE